MHKIGLLCIIVSLFFLMGCGDQRILEELGFTQSVSYDLAEQKEGQTDNQLLITVSIPRADPEDRKVKRETLTATAKTIKQAKIKLDRMTELIIVSGQLRNNLFGISLAKEGLREHIDTLMRDPAISQRVKVTVVNGSAHDLLMKDYATHPRTGQYVDRMLQKQSNANTVPHMTLYEFVRDLFDDGIDPVAPIVKDNGSKVLIDGIALFNNDRYITKIEPDKSLIFAFLRGSFKQGDLSINLGQVGRPDEHVMFSSLLSKRTMKVTSIDNKQQFKVDIQFQVKGSVMEYIGELKLTNDNEKKKLEKLISDYISQETTKMITVMQRNNVDSIGIGAYVRNSLSYSEWTKLDWDQVYPQVEVNCSASLKIKDYGKFEK
ncbi:MAG: Ger(x)C family spore germination protein [Candidatus Pristimantibacillus sp.]